MKDTIFILKTISIKKKTKEDLVKDYKIANITAKKPYTYDGYSKFAHSWRLDKYNYSVEDNCYFTKYQNAENYATNNHGDLNDGGVYNYIAIVEIPCNTIYARSEVQYVSIFQYDNKTNKYYGEPYYYNDETKFIYNKFRPVNDAK